MNMNGNDVSAAVAKYAPDKIVPFMSLHPLDPGVNDEYDRCVGDLGCKGIKMAANYQDFDPNGEAAYRLYARLEADGIPIIWHMGTSPMWDAPLLYAHPLTFDRVAAAFPKLKMIMAHLGHPWHVDTVTMVRKHPNVWADVSAQFYRPWSYWNGMRLFHEWGVTQQDPLRLGLAGNDAAGQHRPPARAQQVRGRPPPARHPRTGDRSHHQPGRCRASGCFLDNCVDCVIES